VTQADAPRRPGRPRDPQADAAILDAAQAVLRDAGFGGFTVDAVAARAGVGKATIYRRWTSREDLLFDVARSIVEPQQDPDSGSLRDDLVELFSTAYVAKARALATERGDLMAAIVAEAAVNAELKRLLREFLDQRRELTRAIVERAVQRGELAIDIDRDLLIDLIAGPLFYRTTMSGRSVDEPIVATVVGIVLQGLGAAAGQSMS
jgi:AcrR family transcriptional regulator